MNPGSDELKKLTTAQAVMLLPTQTDVRELMDACGCSPGEVLPKLAAAISRIMRELVASPNNPELWKELANAFGCHYLMKWKYLYIAHRLQPADFDILSDLAWTYYLIGDHLNGIDLMVMAITKARSEAERAWGIEYLSRMKYPEPDEIKPLVLM